MGRQIVVRVTGGRSRPARPSPRHTLGPVLPADWYLTADERGNPSTRLDRRHPDGRSWTEGNLVTPLVHGRAYFAALAERVSQMREGDLLLFVDWRGDPDQRLTGERGSEVAVVGRPDDRLVRAPAPAPPDRAHGFPVERLRRGRRRTPPARSRSPPVWPWPRYSSRISRSPRNSVMVWTGSTPRAITATESR